MKHPGDPNVEKIPIKTHLVMRGDDIEDIVVRYAGHLVIPGDTIIITSKIVSVCQRRTKHFNQLTPGFWAKILWRFVTVPRWGIGAVGLPEKMQAAIDLAGLPTILIGAAFGMVGRLTHRTGYFFKVAGHGVAEIDGSRVLTFDPFIRVIIWGPHNADKVANNIRDKIGVEVAIIDAGDWGNVDVLGASDNCDHEFVLRNCRDNPLGQTTECTPVGILRKLDHNIR